MANPLLPSLSRPVGESLSVVSTSLSRFVKKNATKMEFRKGCRSFLEGMSERGSDRRWGVIIKTISYHLAEESSPTTTTTSDLIIGKLKDRIRCVFFLDQCRRTCGSNKLVSFQKQAWRQSAKWKSRQYISHFALANAYRVWHANYTVSYCKTYWKFSRILFPPSPVNQVSG